MGKTEYPSYADITTTRLFADTAREARADSPPLLGDRRQARLCRPMVVHSLGRSRGGGDDHRPLDPPFPEAQSPAGGAAMTKPNPKAVGLKALVASGRFSLSACRVGLALLDHYNLDTGRCDPGKGRIAFELDIALTSVKTALKELTNGPDRLFDLQRRVGGASNAYVPRWEPIYAIVRAFEARGRTKDRQSAKKAEDEARGRRIPPYQKQMLRRGIIPALG